MVRCSVFLSLLATASTVSAARDHLQSNTRGSARGRHGRPAEETPEQVPGAYIVEFEEGATASQFRVQAEPQYETVMTLDYELFSGISIRLDDADTAEERAAQLATLPAVKNIWPVKRIQRPEPVLRPGETRKARPTDRRGRSANNAVTKRQQPGNETVAYDPHVMTGVDKLHAEGITGAGITIAVIDTGVDYDHPSLGGCFGEGCKVAYGYDLVGDEGDTPDDDPDDTCDYHGTHVAGIVAAGGDNPEGFKGVAPDATLAAYRVFDCYGFTTTDILISAFNMAYEQGADIITSSIGSYSGWPSEPWAVAASRIVEKGVPCTLAAGNGAIGIFDSSSAADGHGVISVGSFDSPLIIETWSEAFYSVDNGENEAFPWDWSFPYYMDGVEREVWAASLDINNTRDACDPLPDDTPDLADYYVLFRMSEECDVFDQAQNLAAKGARFLVRYNFDDFVDWYDVEYGGLEDVILGTASIFRATGEEWIEALQAGSTVKAVFEFFEDAGSFFVRRRDVMDPGAISFFSSWGPTWEMDFKPQFGAPGGDIYSTLPLEMGSYGVLSGTSMATPFVAGALALISQARGIKPEPKLLESLLSSTARAQLFSFDTPFEDFLAPSAQQGAGLINVYDAVHATGRLEPPSLSFNDTANSPGTMNFTIINESDEDVTYDISHVPSHSMYILEETEDLMVYGPGEFSPVTAELSFSDTKITVGAGSTATVQVTATEPQGLDVARYPYWSGYITVNGTDGMGLALPYQGLVGSMKEANMIPSVFLYDNADWESPSIPDNASFVLPPQGEFPEDEDASYPVIETWLEWGTRVMHIDVVTATTCTNGTYPVTGGYNSIGEIVNWPLEFLPRTILGSGWIGELSTGQFAPPGRYRLLVRVQRLLTDGDEDEEDNWQIWASPPFFISYESPASNTTTRRT